MLKKPCNIIIVGLKPLVISVFCMLNYQQGILMCHKCYLANKCFQMIASATVFSFLHFLIKINHASEVKA